MASSGVIISARQITTPEFVNEIINLNPIQIILRLHSTTELGKLEFFENINIPIYPLFIIPTESPRVLLSMISQSVETLSSTKIYFMASETVPIASFRDYVTIFNTIYKSTPFINLPVFVCTTPFTDKLKNNVSVLLHPENHQMSLDFKTYPAEIFGNTEEDHEILLSDKFQRQYETMEKMEFIYMDILTAGWNTLEPIINYQQIVNFWTLASYERHMGNKKIVIPDPYIIARAVPKRERISIWSDPDLRENVILKIGPSASIQLIEIIQKGTHKVGKLLTGGYVDLDNFDITLIEKGD